MASVAKRTWVHNGAEKSAWVVRYTDAAGKRRIKTFELKKAADRFRTKVEAEIERGEHVADGDAITMDRLCTLFLEHAEARSEDGRIGIARFKALTGYVNAFRKHLGSVRTTDLSVAMVERLYIDLQKKDGQCPRTAKDRIMILKQLQELAIRRGYMAKRPVDVVLKDLRGVKRRPIRTFTQDEVGRLLAAASLPPAKRRERSAPLIECVVNLAAFCGLRYGEIMGLRLANVDLTRRVILVRHSLCRHAGLKGPKTAAGVRDVPMPPHLVAMLRRWIEAHYLANPDGLLFRNSAGSEVHATAFHRKLWHPLLKRAGLLDGERFRFHALRHFAASWMIAHGLPVTEVAELLGHANFDVTLQVYAHPVLPKNYRHDAIERMAASLLSAPRTLDMALPA